MMSNATALLKELAHALRLTYEQQDWGIVNADSKRLDEFLAFFESHRELAETQRYELVGLILASANERLLDEPGDPLRSVRAFLSRHEADTLTHRGYWESLECEEVFPLGARLREWAACS